MDRTGVVPVAVIGMACRLPGGIDSPDALWEALLRGDDLVTEVPAHRWDVEEFYDPEPGVPGRTVCKWGSFLDDVADFDPEFFGISEREATEMDPQHRLLLQTSWEAMEHAGLTRAALAAVRTGVFVGLMHDDYLFMHADADTLSGPYGYMGNSFAMGSGRVSYAMGLSGPAMTVDTACSSGLSAIHLACQSLQDGESDLALAGGASVTLEPRKAASGSAIGMLSATGHCHAFDVNADGFVSGEGAVMILLKRLEDAQRDGDRILAVVRGTAANQDGRTVNIVTPSLPAQVSAYRAALAAADVDPTTVGMVEAHGTGTPTGDPIEYASLAEVYGTSGPCALASVKTNFGHTQSAAGALGLMKAVLAVQHGVIPQNLHFTQMPEKFAEIKTNLFVPQENTPWPSQDPGTPRRAAVSSYGFSGTNVHAVLEQAPAPAAKIVEAQDSEGLQGALIFAVSSSSEDGLRNTAARLADWIDTQDDLDIRDLAYTLARRRNPRPVRATVIAADRAQLTAALREITTGEVPYPPAIGLDDKGPVWVFSGQGSQWAEMGKDLLAYEPVFAAKIAEIEPLIAAESGFSVTEAMTAPEKVTGIDRVQPTLFAMQVALAATMKAYGANPGAVVGHSLGESAAAVVAGALSLEDGVKVICRRSKLMTRISGAGAMAAVELPAEEVITQLVSRGVTDVVVAVVASPQSTVIGGATQSVRDLVAAWEERDVMAREVAVDVASHSPQVDPILDELYEVLADIEPLQPEVPYYSATSFDPREEPYCDAGYWADNLRHTVRFAAAVQAALEDGFKVFTELSPHPLLTNAVDQTARALDKTATALAAMRREQPLPHGLRGLVGELYAAGAALDFSVLYPSGRLLDAPLPCWSQRSLFLTTSGLDSVARRSALVPAHPLMGVHVRLPEEPERHVWQGEVGTAAVPWLADYQIRSAATLPGAVYCEMALVAARTVLGDQVEVRDLSFECTLLLDEATPVGITATFEAPDVVALTVETNQEGRYERQATAVLHAADPADQPPAHDLGGLLATHPRKVDSDEIRKWMDKRGHRLGAAFGGLGAAYLAEAAGNTVLAEVSLPGPLRPQQGAYGVVHPALLDACFQAVAAHPSVAAAVDGGLLLPLRIRRLRAYGSARHARYCYATVTSCVAAGVDADLDIVDDNGTVLLEVRGLRLGTGASPDSERDRVLSERLLTIEWQPAELPEKAVTDPGNWLLIRTSEAADMLATQLTDALKVLDAQCTTLSWSFTDDHATCAQRLRGQLESGSFAGVVLLTATQQGPERESGQRGEQYVEQVVRITRQLPELLGSPPRVYALTRNAQTVLSGDHANLEQGGLRGLLRVIGSENPQLKVSYVDLDEQTGVEQVARQLLLATDEDETAWRDDQWYTARMRPTPLQPEERLTTIVNHNPQGSGVGMRLQIRTPGDLETLEFAAFDRTAPGPGEIEVAVSASSVNFADVLATFGRYQTFDGKLPELGMDFAGVVTAVGPDVTGRKVGDRVAGLSTNGCWATFLTCDARLATDVPEGLTDAQAAAATTAYATAWYGLHELARIRSGDKVLIHSATGGVGQAAIAIARAAGAQVFCTAGSPQRREMLHAMGIEHVYDSRSTEFAEQIRSDTDGYGVDIVLNSLTGAAQQAGIRLLALGGRFVEIGKRDIYSNTRLELFPFRQNLAFYGVDLALMADSHPAQVHELLDTVYRQIATGALPPPQTTHYPMADAATAIRVMGAAEHTGKLILDVPHVGRSSVVMPPEYAPAFRGDGSYLITGGLGGLGLFLAEKMAGAGAGRIVLSSRSQPNQKALETIELVRSMGADVVVACGDIAEAGTADRLVAAATATGLPLRGVLHAAAVVEDATLPNITDELIARDWAPKVYGAWNLHEATKDQELDWFCSFSSAAALVGSPGQGAYAAANSWLDAFTHWRRAQGLPATSIAWGPWAEIGRGTDFAETAGDAIHPEEGAYAFEALLRHNRAYTGYAPIIGSPWLNAFAQQSPFAEAFRSTAKHAGNSKFLTELDRLPQDEWPARLRRMVSEQIGLILRRTIDVDRMLTEYGLDSLSSQELRTRLEAETGVRITATNINTTVRSLADLLYDELTSA
ncbi:MULTISPECIES: sulfolipid-1 biosynthesis phthioceranic/hydroxyphthioceranic acid synthase [Mycobacterium]|nr:MULTISPECIES: sulfolipid-1 biosynthesis phthioceranic/hydroxyphthioceranic acid synthase [Mycobacterium]